VWCIKHSHQVSYAKQYALCICEQFSVLYTSCENHGTYISTQDIFNWTIPWYAKCYIVECWTRVHTHYNTSFSKSTPCLAENCCYKWCI